MAKGHAKRFLHMQGSDSSVDASRQSSRLAYFCLGKSACLFFSCLSEPKIYHYADTTRFGPLYGLGRTFAAPTRPRPRLIASTKVKAHAAIFSTHAPLVCS